LTRPLTYIGEYSPSVTLSCTHFAWSKVYGCWLKHAESEEEVRKSFVEGVYACGIVRDRFKKASSNTKQGRK
uniref:Uncharacterized protein n=1 Tax=Romanomermis culicivorax TaxID=13658 RepID=A0A915IZH4_ROMCU